MSKAIKTDYMEFIFTRVVFGIALTAVQVRNYINDI